MRLMDNKSDSTRRRFSFWEYEFSRDGTHGEVRGQFWATGDLRTGELAFCCKLPNVIRDFQEDFDVCILVVAWGLWGLANQVGIFARDYSGLSDEEDCLAS